MKTKKLTHLALLITLALVIHIVEHSIPIPIAIPGAKLGLANVITLLTFVLYGLNSALFVTVVRTILGSFFAGTFLGPGFVLSFSGGIVATLMMAVGIAFWRKNKLSLVVVSIMGAVAHNVTQVTIAALFYIENVNLISLYLPILLFLALPTGFFTGLAVTYTQKALGNVIPDIKDYDINIRKLN